VASVASNVRDLPPFAAAGNDGSNGARASWTSGQQLLARGDSAAARDALQRARDLDVVRFRAPSSFNGIIARTAKAQQATYVPVAEAFASASPAGLPGHELFLEHLHPTRDGVVLLARTFYEALRSQQFLGHQAREAALRPWDEYRARMALSPFDERIAAHTVASLTARWPFVAVAEQRDYRGTYRPVDAADSLALLTSRGGMAWEAAKLARIRSQFVDSSFAAAVDEARGLVRDAPLQGTPWEVLGRALVGAGRPAEGDSALQRAFGLAPSAGTAFTLGVLALQAKRPTDGVSWLERSLRLDGTNPDAAYQLSLAYALSGDAVRARQLATALARRMPTYPGLGAWLQALGISPPR
jgi:Flp pilus assembly protein TadD